MKTEKKLDIKVLLVEDNPVFVLMAQIKLRQLGIEAVHCEENGLSAMNYLQKNTPDIIFLDINMPTMDGFEFLNANKKYKLCPKTPIVMLTSSARSCDRERAMQYESVVDFLEKPLTYSKLENLLVKLSWKNKVKKIELLLKTLKR